MLKYFTVEDVEHTVISTICWEGAENLADKGHLLFMARTALKQSRRGFTKEDGAASYKGLFEGFVIQWRFGGKSKVDLTLEQC
jgi:hypothetical protein